MTKISAFLRKALLIAPLVLIAGDPSAAETRDSYLFEKDGFRIHYVGNGGNCDGCEWIAIEGSILPDAGDLFQQYVTKHGFKGLRLYVALNSKGGSLAGGIRLGRAIRNLKMDTSVGKTVRQPDTEFYRTERGVCYSACAYAFLGGVERSVDKGEYGVHQFFTDALLKDPNGKVFSPADFSEQQTITGLLLAYVVEMGVSADLVVEANKTPPSAMNVLTSETLTRLRVVYDPKHYGGWKLESFRKGLIAYSRTQDEQNQMTLYCLTPSRAELLITYTLRSDDKDRFKERLEQIKKFSLLHIAMSHESLRIESRSNGVAMRVPLKEAAIEALEKNRDPHGAFSVHSDEPRVHYGDVHERISLGDLSSAVRLVRRNCIN